MSSSIFPRPESTSNVTQGGLLPHPFDEPLGFRIRHIEVISEAHSAGLRFQSQRWKPPTQTNGVRRVQNVQYKSASQETKFVWRSPRNHYPGQAQNPHLGQKQSTQVVTRMTEAEKSFFRPHKTASLFWAPDNGTFLHVPFDCTKQHVEDPNQDEPGSDDDSQQREGDDARVRPPNLSRGEQPSQPQQPRETWRRLRFHHYYPGPSHPPISLARYHAGSNELGGTLPDRWTGTLMPAVHRPDVPCEMDCQLAGDLPILLGLVAFCHASNDMAVGAIATWFPPSRGTTHWAGPESAHAMQHCDQRPRRGMVIETFYDSRRPDAQNRLRRWEEGFNGPIIT